MQTVIEHVLGVCPPKKAQVAVPADELSPWISTSISLDRAVFQVTKRLANSNLDLVRMAVIRRRQNGQQWIFGETGFHTLNMIPWFYLNAIDHTSATQSHLVERAIKAVSDSSELLFYGRIFSEVIEADLVWTKDVRLSVYQHDKLIVTRICSTSR
jgi:hypothetical protein